MSASTTLVLIRAPNVGTPALSREACAAVLVAGSEVMGAGPMGGSARANVGPLVEAEQAAQQHALHSGRGLAANAGAGIVPHDKLGRFVRSQASEVAAYCRVSSAGAAG